MHTPGPWKATEDQDDESFHIGVDKADFCIADVHLWSDVPQESEANARLIAKAPELHALALRIARLNRDAGEIGAGMLASLVDEARRLTDES